MKKQESTNWLTLALILGLAFGLSNFNQAKANGFNGISFEVFYDELRHYGDWVNDPRHGSIWLPEVGPDFHPYGTNGHWAMTEFGNTWVSYYDWGWAPFHYGRWYFDDFYRSWAWVPGYEWGPAWVNWRTGGGYYGWAPLRPGFSINISIGIPHSYFVFLPRHRIYNYHAYRFFAPRRQRVRIYNQTTIINNTVVYNNNHYVTGPSRREVQRVTRQNVPVYRTQNNGQRGRRLVAQNGQSVYQGRSSQNTATRSTRSADVRSSRESSSRGRELAQPRNTRAAAGNSTRSSRNAQPASANAGTPRFETKPYAESSRTRTSTSRSSRSTKASSSRSSRQASPQRSASPSVRSSESSSRRVEAKRPSSSSRTTKARPSSSSDTRQRATTSRPSSSNSSPRASQSSRTSRTEVKKSTSTRKSSAISKRRTSRRGN